MKLKTLILILPLITLSLSLFAGAPVDSIGVKNNDGKKMVLFKVKAGDTYYSIGHRYNIKPEVLMKFNGKKKEILSIGAVVEVPTDMPFKKSKKEKEEIAAKETKNEKKARLSREDREAAAEEEARNKKREDENKSDNTPPERPTATVVKQPTQQQPVQQQPVRVVQQPAVVTPPPVQQDNTPPTQYKVSAGETLYSIAKRFNSTVDEITRLNNLTSTNLAPGQLLLVKPAQQQAPPQAPPVVNTDTQRIVATRDSNLLPGIAKDSSNAERRLDANRFGLYEKNEKGVATWIDEPSLDPNKKLVLHRTAPIGTVIKITNPMTNRTTFAKVVGSFTDNESTKDCIVVMTKNVADSLGALDKRFHVNISYGTPNE
ncbi:MAG: DPBB and LysM peptidoglycan-binding domain-containing protein [Mucilaginibacter sp.]